MLDSANLLVLTGVPGVGKTRLALALSQANEGATYEFVWWLRAADEAQFSASIGRLCDSAGVRPASTPSETLRVLVGAMRQPGLIVLDDAADWEAVKPYVAASGPTKVIVTTSSDSPDGMHIRGLGSSEGVVEFVNARTGLPESEALRLIEAVDGLPLLLLHACQYISASGSSVTDYLAILERPSKIFRAWPYHPVDYEDAQSRIVPLSLIGLAETSIAWRRLCGLLPMLAPVPIPLPFFEAFDDNASSFVSAAQRSFVLVRNPSSQTAEVPTLIRGAINELGLADNPGEIRESVWRALAELTAQDVSPSHQGYLAEHISYLGVNSDAVAAAANLAIDLGERPLAVSMWRHAYNGAVLGTGDRHARVRVEMAESLGWALMKQGHYHEAERTASHELALVNDAGCITCRAPLLHLLGHLVEASRKPENEALRMFQATESAMRICGEDQAEIGQILADIIFACRRGIGEALKESEPSGPKVEELIESGTRALLALKEAERNLAPLGSSGVQVSTLRRWEAAADAWGKVLKDAEDRQPKTDSAVASGQDVDGLADEKAIADWTPSGAFIDLINALLHRDYDIEELADIGARLGVLSHAGESTEEAGELAGALQGDSEALRSKLVRQYGEESHAIGLADFIEMIAAHIDSEEKRAAHACRRFLIGTLEATNMARTIALLHKGLSFSLRPREDETQLDGYVIMTRGAPWLRLLPEVDAFLWLSFQLWSDSGQLPERRSVHRAIHQVRKLGVSGPSLAALMAHQYAHRKHLSPTDSLRYHRIAVRMYQTMGVPVSDWGHALYCYAHNLLKVEQPEAATRRFLEAREMLTAVDSGSTAARHIDEHLNSEIAPFLKDEE